MKTIKNFNQFVEGAGFGTAHSNVPEGVPTRVEPQDRLIKRAKMLLGYDVKDLEVAADKLSNKTDINAVLKQLYKLDSEEAKIFKPKKLHVFINPEFN